MISDSSVYWIRLAGALGFDNIKIKKLRELYPNISEFFKGGVREWKYCGVLTYRDIEKLKHSDNDAAQKIISKSRQLGYSIIAIDDPAYPKCLYDIDSPPAVLYVDGRLPDVDNRLSVAIVGTRRAQKYGIDNSFKFAYALSKYTVVTVSGGALGVDCASHRGSLSAKGETVCVLGCGINYKYLSENAGMRKAIAQNGAVISEYPPDSPPLRFHFPSRNRIISALSDGVLIIEAGLKSGALITANLAVDQGKEVFALIGNNSPQNEGSNNKIKEGTAIPVTDFMDILNIFDRNKGLYINDKKVDLDEISPSEIRKVPIKGKKPIKAYDNVNKQPERKSAAESKTAAPPAVKNTISPSGGAGDSSKSKKTSDINIDLSDTAQSVYGIISDEPIHIDLIADKLKIPVSKILPAITELEIEGLVKALQGRRYILN